jgi:Skp family chaperone for outer membrane proteins
VLSVKAVPVRAAYVAAILTTSLLSSAALGQAVPGARTPVAAPAAAPPAGTNVAVIDIAFIFKNHNKFKGQMEGMKGQIEQFEQSLKKDQADFEKRREQLQAYKPSSPEFKALEEQLAKLSSELQVKMQLKRKEFLEQEAKIYFAVYNEIVERVASFADRNRIGLVLRYNSDEMDAQDRGSVLQGVNRPVVFQRNLDITDIILQACNAGTTAPATTTRPLGTATRPGSNTLAPSTPRGVNR